MVNFDSPCVESEQSKDVKEKEASIDIIALEIVKEFPEHFLGHSISYVGVQSGTKLCKDACIFNIASIGFVACGAAFVVRKLDAQTVADAFVLKMKAFGEDVVEVE